MSTAPQPIDAKKDPAPQYHFSQPERTRVRIPKLFIVAGVAIVVIAALLVAFRGKMAESSAWDAMQSCEATLTTPDTKFGASRERIADNDYVWIKPNGTHDGYGMIHIGAKRDDVSAVVGLCETEPQLALKLFQRAMKEGNASAKLIALHCANYLARSQTRPYPDKQKGILEESDFELMAGAMAGDPSMDVRRVAMRALSDLIVITTPADVSAYNPESKTPLPRFAASPKMEEAAKANLKAEAIVSAAESNKNIPDKAEELVIAVHKSELEGKPVLLIRWSQPTLAKIWWEEHKKEGKWDKSLQRYVFP